MEIKRETGAAGVVQKTTPVRAFTAEEMARCEDRVARQRMRSRNAYVRNRHKWEEYHRNRMSDPEKAKRFLEQSRANSKSRADMHRANGTYTEWRKGEWLKKLYGLTLAEYKLMNEQQGGVCALCGGVSSKGRALAVDHNHTTKRVRALLCNTCNTAIGGFKDNPDLMEKAAAYVRKYAQ